MIDSARSTDQCERPLIGGGGAERLIGTIGSRRYNGAQPRSSLIGGGWRAICAPMGPVVKGQTGGGAGWRLFFVSSSSSCSGTVGEFLARKNRWAGDGGAGAAARGMIGSGAEGYSNYYCREQRKSR